MLNKFPQPISSLQHCSSSKKNRATFAFNSSFSLPTPAHCPISLKSPAAPQCQKQNYLPIKKQIKWNQIDDLIKKQLPLDALLVKILCSLSIHYPGLSQSELAYYTQRRVQKIQEIGARFSPTQLRKILFALYIEEIQMLPARMEHILTLLSYPHAKFLKEELTTLKNDFPHLGCDAIIEKLLTFLQSGYRTLHALKVEEIDLVIFDRAHAQAALFTEKEEKNSHAN